MGITGKIIKERIKEKIYIQDQKTKEKLQTNKKITTTWKPPKINHHQEKNRQLLALKGRKDHRPTVEDRHFLRFREVIFILPSIRRGKSARSRLSRSGPKLLHSDEVRESQQSATSTCSSEGKPLRQRKYIIIQS